MNSTVSVAIIGGEACGLMTALLLARAGTRGVVLEKKPVIQLIPRPWAVYGIGVGKALMDIVQSKSEAALVLL
jgi:2-polyprenyl-6-methoxyphenol hydroxylase-like FAD-dependent oxidoreductase